MDSVIDILERRGLLEDLTSPDARTVMGAKPCVVYAGFDPSAHSLQVGNLVTIMGLSHFQRCGHRVIALIGGATGLVGDPAGRRSERPLLDEEQVAHNIEGIKENLSRFLDFEHPTAPAKIVNNNDWMKQFTFTDFLREVGKHFRVGTMLGKESVRARLESGGISFAEFSYPLLQAYDFLHLHDTEGCHAQLGGSDQWGNITAGADLVRRLRGAEVYGVTMPIICDSNNVKFGKSEGNALFLNAALTSCYDFYQFFVRVTDDDVIRFLKVFTFLPLEEIDALACRVAEAPEQRTAQRRLAEAMTRMVHGEDGLALARRASDVLFGGELTGLSVDDLLGIFADVPSAELAREAVVGASAVDVAAAVGLCRSKGEARRLASSGGLYVNNRRVDGPAAVLPGSDVIEGRILVLRSGKKRFHLVKVV